TDAASARDGVLSPHPVDTTTPSATKSDRTYPRGTDQLRA
ncbi:MAG: hypothetical protein K0S86_4580, partial [Geminicoccaceae bacterium]|nr:hypothetical protein [Geminicoccaceae bacterium]